MGRWLKRGIIALALLPVGLIALVALLLISDDVVRSWSWHDYAEAHPLSAALFEAGQIPGGGIRAGTEQQKRILFQRVSLGTPWQEAKQAMISEGFGCNDPKDHDGRSTLQCMHNRSLEWQPHWLVKFDLDGAGRLTDAETDLLK